MAFFITVPKAYKLQFPGRAINMEACMKEAPRTSGRHWFIIIIIIITPRSASIVHIHSIFYESLIYTEALQQLKSHVRQITSKPTKHNGTTLLSISSICIILQWRMCNANIELEDKDSSQLIILVTVLFHVTKYFWQMISYIAKYWIVKTKI